MGHVLPKAIRGRTKKQRKGYVELILLELLTGHAMREALAAGKGDETDSGRIEGLRFHAWNRTTKHSAYECICVLARLFYYELEIVLI